MFSQHFNRAFLGSLVRHPRNRPVRFSIRTFMTHFYRQTGLAMNYCKRSRYIKLLPRTAQGCLASMALLPFGIIKAEGVLKVEEERLCLVEQQTSNELVSKEEIDKSIANFKQVTSSMSSSSSSAADKEGVSDEWELVMDKNGFKLWRCSVPNSSACHYRCYGIVKDIPACAFFKVQLEDELRATTDKSIKHLVSNPILINTNNEDSKNNNSGTATEQLYHWSKSHPIKGLDEVQWIHAFPFPLKSRYYSYYRRAVFIPEDNVFVIVSKANGKPTPQNDKTFQDCVEIETYYSTMVIRPLDGKSTSEAGFEYVLSYLDDPQIVLPNRILTIATSEGIPRLIEQLCTSARVFLVSNKQACFDANQEYSIDPKVRQSFLRNKHKQEEEKGNKTSSSSDSGNEINSKKYAFRETPSSSSSYTEPEHDVGFHNSEINFKDLDNELHFFVSRSYTHNQVQVLDIDKIKLQMDSFVRKYDFVFNRISDKEAFDFDQQ